MLPREPYDFVFKGFSVWLEVEQEDRDLERAIAAAALDHGLFPIPEPHVTIVYGVSHLSEDDVRALFRDRIVAKISKWPRLSPKGVTRGVCFDGVDGQEMDMSWFELTLETAPEHELLVDQVHSAFYSDFDVVGRTGQWQPHVSIAYDNPMDSPLDDIYAEKVFAQMPSLLGCKSRGVKAISLWKTQGRINEWVCLDKAVLRKSSAK